MANPPRVPLRAAFDAVPSHQQTLAQDYSPLVAPLRDGDVPDGTSQPSGSVRMSSASRHHGSGSGTTPQETPPRHVHRSLYASAETFDLIREIAHAKRIPAQELYREGLLLMLQKRGYYRDKTAEDI